MSYAIIDLIFLMRAGMGKWRGWGLCDFDEELEDLKGGVLFSLLSKNTGSRTWTAS